MYSGLLFNVVDRPYLGRSLGVYRIAHYLREKNLDIEVIDYSNFWTLEQLQTLFQSRYNGNLKFIGFSQLFSNVWAETLERFCQWIKIEYSHVSIISGSAANPMFDSKYIDFYIQGYGEYAVESLLKYVISNGPSPKFKFLTGDKKVIDAIHFYPAFPMNSLMVKYEDRDFIEPQEWLGIEFSRGCKFKCDFCNFPVLGVKGDYTRDAEDFREQMLDTYDKFGVANYYVADETFNDRTEKITKFADVVETLPFSPWFVGYIRPDLLVSRSKDREELLRMNFLGHYYGVETFNKESGKAIGKGMDSDRLLSGLVEIKDFFKKSGTKQYRGSISLIAGLPYDTFETFNFTKKWLINNWADQSYIIYYLYISADPKVKSSLISTDYAKYGYRKLSKELIEKYSSLVDSHMWGNMLLWENSNMNIFDASNFVNEMIKLKSDKKSAFTIPIFNLSNRYKGNLSITDRLKITYNQYDSVKSVEHIPSYISKKLGYHR